MNWTPSSAREQEPLSSTPYDRWVSPEGVCMAEFHRVGADYLLRFPHQADFLIEKSELSVTGWTAPECDDATVVNLFHNAIQPLIGNHRGGLFLHGSAVTIGDAGGVAFLGLSRGGKTTLAGSFAKAGFPFLTEDVIDLDMRDGEYWVRPKRSKLRLFADSARQLLGEGTEIDDEDRKQDVEAGNALPFADEPVPLRQIYVLGTDHTAPLSIRELSLQQALGALMPHAFILDVEDKVRLREHFSRMADLSQDIGCFSLDYRREYGELPRIRKAIIDNFAEA